MNITPPSPGLVVDLLGPDGSGKSTLARGLAARLWADGVATTLCRWSDIVDGRLSTDESLGTLLRELYVEAWRALYVGATDDRSRRLSQAPPDFAGFRAAGLECEAPSQPLGATASGMTASALLEFVADVVIAAQVVRPLVRGGPCRRGGQFGDQERRQGAERGRGAGQRRAEPVRLPAADRRAGRLPVALPHAGHRDRARRRPRGVPGQAAGSAGSGGPVEDLAFAGRTDDSFVELQRDMLAQYLRVAAESPSWHVIEATDLTPAELVDHAAALIHGFLAGRSEQSGPAVKDTP